MPTSTPPTTTTILGPKRSTNQPSTGTSQVSVNTKMVKATWMAARSQPYFCPIGPTNSVQPYCRLAIMTMQTMPISNCSQRLAGGLTAAVWYVSIVLPNICFLILLLLQDTILPQPGGEA